MSSSLNALAHFNMAMGLWTLMSTGSNLDWDKGWAETRCCVKDHMKVFSMMHLKSGTDVDLMWGKMLKQNTDMLMVSTRGRLRNHLLIPQMENMWNGNNWEFIRKRLKNPGCFLFSRNCAGQGMLELKTLYLCWCGNLDHFRHISGLNRNSIWISSLFGLIDTFERLGLLLNWFHK